MAEVWWIEEPDGIAEDALIRNAPPITFDAAAYDRALDDAQATLASFFRRSWKRQTAQA